MVSKSHTLKKRIVFTALSPHLSEEKLLEALIIWETNFADSPSVSVQKYLREIKDKVAPEMDARDALMSLVRTGAVPESKLLADPSMQIEAYKSYRKAKERLRYTHPDVAVFIALILSWRKMLTTVENNKVYEFVSENINSVDVNKETATSFVVWLRVTNIEFQSYNAEIVELRELISLFYAGSCESVGPVKTDVILRKVVQTVKGQHPDRVSTVDRFL